MAKKIEEIEGIGGSYGEKLRAAGIATTDDLLAAGRTPAGRKGLCEKTGLGDGQVLKWINMADLFRIKGVASQYAELLECAGVDTVKELKMRNAENLATKMKEINDEKKLCKSPPSAKVVADWVAQAKDLLPGIEY